VEERENDVEYWELKKLVLSVKIIVDGLTKTKAIIKYILFLNKIKIKMTNLSIFVIF
jgi:hypothetical protein